MYKRQDGDTLTVSELKADNGILTDNEDGTYTFTPALNYNGVVSLNYYVDDNNGIKVFNTTSFTLDAVNDAPVQSETVNVLKPGTEDSSYLFTSEQLLRSFSDVDGDNLSVTAVNAVNGTVTNLGDGEWQLTPDADYFGVVDLTFSVTDGTVNVDGTNSVTIEAVNDAPIATFTGTDGATEDTFVITGTPVSYTHLTLPTILRV